MTNCSIHPRANATADAAGSQLTARSYEQGILTGGPKKANRLLFKSLRDRESRFKLRELAKGLTNE